MNNLLTNMSASTAVAASGIVPLGSAIHGYGKSIRLIGSGIQIRSAGYYDITASLSVAVTGTDAITAQLYVNGSPITGASASATPSAAGAVVNLTIPWIYRKIGCGCNADTITIVLSAAGTVNNATVLIEQEI